MKHVYMKTNPQDGDLMSYMVISGAEKIHSCVKVFKDKTLSADKLTAASL